MATGMRQWFANLGPYGKRGLIYSLVGFAGLTTELLRSGLGRPFGLVIWAIIIGIGLYSYFILAKKQS